MISITFKSTKEEVANYFLTLCKFGEETKNNFIKEDISGDILLDLDDTDFKKLNLKLGQMKKIKKYIEENKENLIKKEIKEVISIYSSPEEVSAFFESSLNFKESLNKLDGKGLLELNNEEIEKLGLNLGQKKKLVKFIQHFKTLKVEPPQVPEIDINSSEEDVANFLKIKLGFSKEAIESLGIDGETLFSLEENEIKKEENLKEEEKNKLIEFLKENKKGEKPEIIITKESNEDDVVKFLKKNLGFSEESIKSLCLDGDGLFSLEEKEIQAEETLSKIEKEKLIEFLKENKMTEEPEIIITKESKEEDVANFLKIKLGFSKEAIESLQLDGETLFSLKENEIKKEENLKEEEKNKLIEFLKDNNIDEEPEIIITKESSEDDIAKFLKKNLGFSEESIKSLCLDGDGLFSLEEKEIQEEDKLKPEEKDKLIKYLKENNILKESTPEPEPKPPHPRDPINITINSSKEDIFEFLKEQLKFSEKSLKSLDYLDGKKLFNLDKNKINKYNDLSKEEKEKLIKYLEDNKQSDQPKPEPEIFITKQSSKEEVANYLKITLKFSEKSIKSLNLTGKELFKLEEKKIEKNKDLSEDEKKKLKNFINHINSKIKEYEGIKGKNIQMYNLKNYKISHLINDSSCNIFFMASFYENEIKNIGLSPYDDKREYLKLKFSGYITYEPFYLDEFTLWDQQKNRIKTLLIQIPLNKMVSNLYILFQSDAVLFNQKYTKWKFLITLITIFIFII